MFCIAVLVAHCVYAFSRFRVIGFSRIRTYAHTPSRRTHSALGHFIYHTYIIVEKSLEAAREKQKGKPEW